MPPHLPTVDAAVASDRGPPAEWLVRQPPGHGVTRCALATAAVAPLIGLDGPARQNRTIRGESMAGDFEPKLVKAAERSHVSAGEGNPAGDLDAYPATDAE